MLRLLLLALMGLALASRLALGATLPVANGANTTDALAELQAAMIMCQTGHGHDPTPTPPPGALLSDLLLFDQAENMHALASNPVAVLPRGLSWSAVTFRPGYAASRPPLWRPVSQARAPPATV